MSFSVEKLFFEYSTKQGESATCGPVHNRGRALCAAPQLQTYPDDILTKAQSKHDVRLDPHIIALDPYVTTDVYIDVFGPDTKDFLTSTEQENTMSTGDDDLSSGINGRLRPRKSYVSSPQTTKPTRKDSKPSQEKPKRVSSQSKNPLSKSDDLSKKSDFSSVLEYLCPYCDKFFVSKQTASKHARRIHFLNSKQGDKGVINCLYCNHFEPEPSDIFKHMIDSHPNQYFACLDCHTRFPSTKQLAEHKLNVCERQKLHYKSKLPQKSNRATKKSHKLDRQVVIREEERHGYNSIVISCELKPTHVTDAADIEDNITTNLILPSINKANNIIDKNAVILLDDLQWKKRIPQNFSFHNTDTDQILSRLGVVHRSPRTGESTRKDWFKVIDDATQKFERCFDTNFYSKVASNVQENLSKFLDGSFNFNPDPNHTIKTRKAKNSVPINTVEGFPILLSCAQYSRNIFDGYMPRAIAPKHKWKWDNLENDRNSFNADQIKRDSHVNNCIVTLVSSLDIWTQLCMRHKFEEKFKTTPFEKTTEKKKIISNELKEILESRQLPPSTAQVSRNCTALVKVPDDLDFPTSLGLTPSTAKYDIHPAVLSGEWVRPRCYVCCACGAQTRDPRALSTHILTEHPNAQVQHYEIPGELLMNADILKHLYVPPSPVQNRTRPPRGFRECTKCNKSITIEDLHQHMLDCAGDMPTVRRKCRYRHFGVRKRRTRIQDSRIRKKIRKDIHRQNGRPRPKIRSEVGDAETIRKMLADLPAKRHRVIVTPTGSTLRPRKIINPLLDQLTFNKRHAEDNKNRKLNTDSNTSTDLQGDGEHNNSNKTLKENKGKIMKKKITRRNRVILNKAVRKSYRNDGNLRNDSRIEAASNQLSLSSDSMASSADSKAQMLSLDNQSNRINVNSGPYNTREQANRYNNDRSNPNRENQNPDRNDNNGNFRDQGAPPQNVPLKHSIARLTADSGTHDKAVQFHHLFLVQQECNNATQHDPSGQPVLFEDKAVTVKLDKPPLETSQKSEASDTLNSQKNKLNKHRKGLNDCIAMLKNKLVEPSKAPDVSIQCKIDETSNSELKAIVTNRIDITVQCPDDNQAPETVITPRSRNSINERNIHNENPLISPLQNESTKQRSDLATTHKVGLSIDMENKHVDYPTPLVGITDSSEVTNRERNNYSTVFEETRIPPQSNDSELSDNVSESVRNQQNIESSVSRRSVTPNRQAVNMSAKESKNYSTVQNKESSQSDRSVMQILDSSQASQVNSNQASQHKQANNSQQKINETRNKLYIPEVIAPPAHCIVDSETTLTTPLDLSGKIYVNEVIAHCSKQDTPFNSSAHVYETLDLSNKGIHKNFQQGNFNEMSNDVVDLRVKPAIPSTSTGCFNFNEDMRNTDMIATDLSLRHTECMPTDLSVKGKVKSGVFNEMTREDITSNYTCSQNDNMGLNLSPNEFPTDLSRKGSKVLTQKPVIGQEANNSISIHEINENDNTNAADTSYPQHIENKQIVSTGINIISHSTPLQYNTNTNSYKIQSRQITIPSEVRNNGVRYSANEFNQSRTVQYSSAEVSNKPGSSTPLDKAPINLCNPLKQVSTGESLHKTMHIAPQQPHGSKTLEILNMSLNLINTSHLNTGSLTLSQPSVGVTLDYSNATEISNSITQAVADIQNASDLSHPTSKSRRSQGNMTKKSHELNEKNACVSDQDPETAKKIALLPKELGEILGNIPVDHRNQLLNVLPHYVVSSTSAGPHQHDAFNDPMSSHRHSQLCSEAQSTEMSQYTYSGIPNSQHSIVDRYQIQHHFYQPQGQIRKSEGECVQYPGSSEEANKSSLNDNKRRSIDLSMCGIIDLTDENMDKTSPSISPEKENKTESLTVKTFGFKTNNEKTASLRAVRIKAPSERVKSFISETQLKYTIPEKSYINTHGSDNGNNDLSPLIETSVNKETNATNVHSVVPVVANTSKKVETPLTLNRLELMDGQLEARIEKTTVSSVCNATNVLSNVPLQGKQTDITAYNSESVGKDNVKTSDPEPLFQNVSSEPRLNSQEIEKIQEPFDEDDSEDDVSLAVIVKQKQRQLEKLETYSMNDNTTNKNKNVIRSNDNSEGMTNAADIIQRSEEQRDASMLSKTDKNSSQHDDETTLDISDTSKHKKTLCEIFTTAVEERSITVKDGRRFRNLKHCAIELEKTVLKPSSNDESEVVQASSNDLDLSSLSSNNNTIANKTEVELKKNMISHTELDPSTFGSEKEKKENSSKKITESENRLEKERLVTPLRRSRRGKSLFVENSDESFNFQNISDIGEQRGPYTKKQLIFSKLLQDEENTAAKVPYPDDVEGDKLDENNASSDIDFSFIGEMINTHKKGHTRKHSTHKRKKHSKCKALGTNSISINKNIKDASNNVETTFSALDNDEVSQIQYRENNSDCDEQSHRSLFCVKDVDLSMSKNAKISGKRKSCTSNSNELVLPAKEKKIKTMDSDNINDRDCDNSTKNVNTNDNTINPAGRRCRSKSVISKSISEVYDPYDFELLHKVPEINPNFRRQSENRPSYRNVLSKTSNNNDNEMKPSESIHSTKSILDCCKEEQDQEDAKTRQIIETKVFLSDSDESSRVNEPIKKLPEEKKKKKTRKNHEKSHQEPSETLTKTQRKTVTLETHDTKNTDIDVNTDKLNKEKHRGSSGSSIEFDFIAELYNKREKGDKRKNIPGDKEKQIKFKLLVDNDNLQNERTTETFLIQDAKEVHHHLEINPVKEVDLFTEKSSKITGKRKSYNNQSTFSPDITKKFKSTINNDDVKSNNSNQRAVARIENTTNLTFASPLGQCHSKPILEKSTSDYDPYDFDLLHKPSETHPLLNKESEKRHSHQKIDVKPTEWINCMVDSMHRKQDEAAGQVSETKKRLNTCQVLFSDSDESSKSDVPLTKYLEEKEKRKPLNKHPEQNQKEPRETLSKTDKKLVSVTLGKHDTKITEMKDFTDELDKERSTSSNLELNCLVGSLKSEREKVNHGHISVQKKEKQNKSKPLDDDLTYENENAKVESILDACKVKYDEDSDCGFTSHHQVCPVKDEKAVDKDLKLTGKRKSNTSDSSEIMLSDETKKLKTIIHIDAKSENTIKRNENNTNSVVQGCRSKSVLTESTCEMDDPYDFDMLQTGADPFLKRESIKRLSNLSKLISTHNNNGEVNQTECNVTSTAVRQISEAKTLFNESDESSKSDEPLKKSADKKKRKKHQQKEFHPEPCEALHETQKNKKTLSVPAEKHETKDANTNELPKGKHDESSTSNLECDFQVELLYKRENKDKKSNCLQTKEKHKTSKPLVDNPCLRNENTKQGSDTVKTPILNSGEVIYHENSACDNLNLRQISNPSDEDVPMKITKNSKPNSTNSNNICPSSEGKKLKSNNYNQTIDDNNFDEFVIEPEKSKHFTTTVSLKHAKKPGMRRCRSKSLLVKSTTETYDPYDINLLETVTEAEPFLKREPLSNSFIQKITSKSSVDKDAVVKTVEFNDVSSNISNTENNDQNKQEKQDSVNLQRAKELPCDSDESSKSDEPLTKYIEEKGKKKSESNEEQYKAVRKRKKKTFSVTLEKPDPDTSHEDNEERMRSEQFMESFGFFSERKPRKSNLLATKKISETYNLINSFHESEDRSNKKNVHCENRKTADDEGNLKESFNTSNKKVSKRGRKKKVSTKIESSYCEVCRKQFRRPDNVLRHQMSLAHVSRVSEVELKVKNVPEIEESNYLVIYKQQLDRLRVLQDKISRRKKYCKSLENIALPTFEDIIADVTRMVRQQQLAHRGLSRDEALFLDCCELLNGSHNDDGSGRTKESSDCKINCYTCVQTSAECLNLLEKRINDTIEGKCDDGDVDSITAQDIMESEEVRNLENDLITGLKEAAACASNFKATPITTYTPEVEVDSKLMNTIEHSKDVEVIHPTDEIKNKKAYEVKEKMYPDIIEDIDMFEDKFDKIKRKCRSQAAKQTQYVETSISTKSRKKVEKKKRKKSPKKNSSHSSVPTKGALKGFEGVKVSILTSEINMASILPPLSKPSKKKKRSNNKRKKERKHSENHKYDSDHKSKDTQKKVDVYEFMDSEEAELFEFRPSTLMERFKSINNKDIPSTSKSQPIHIDPEVSTESVSDGDDFVYMSDDYICSDAETENSLMSCELGNTKNSSEVKKSTPKRKDTAEKSAVMGKIFKHNAVRAEKKIAKTKEHIKPKANLDQLFDSLLEEPNSPIIGKSSSSKKEDSYNLESSISHNDSKRVSKSVKNYVHEDPDDSDSDVSRKIERSVTPEPYTSPISPYKRRGPQISSLKVKVSSVNREDDDDLASLSPTTSREDENKINFKHTSRNKKEASYENFDVKSFKHETKRRNTISPNYDDDSLLRVDESSPDDNDSLTYDKRKTKGKEYRIKSTDTDIEKNTCHSFDYTDEPINTLDDTGVARQRARRKCTVGKQNVLAETWSSESEPDGNPPRSNSADSVSGGTNRKKKNRKKDSHTLGVRKSGNRQASAKREADCSTRSNRNSSESISRVVPTSRPSAVCSSSSKARARPSPYYWSDEEEPEHVQQHGWIVGDSHKKLVTMLAHAKGKRNNDDRRNLVE